MTRPTGRHLGKLRAELAVVSSTQGTHHLRYPRFFSVYFAPLLKTDRLKVTSFFFFFSFPPLLRENFNFLPSLLLNPMICSHSLCICIRLLLRRLTRINFSYSIIHSLISTFVSSRFLRLDLIRASLVCTTFVHRYTHTHTQTLV